MGITVVPFLVIIHQINIESIPVNKAENNPPVSRYRNARHALKVALERVETITRQVEIGWVPRSIQVTQRPKTS